MIVFFHATSPHFSRPSFLPAFLPVAGHDITAVETNLEESKAKITSDTDQVDPSTGQRVWPFIPRVDGLMWIGHVIWRTPVDC